MTRIVIVLTENYADWESALLAAVARTYYGAEILTASPDGQKVTSAGGFRVTPDMAIADIDADRTDLLVLNGGTAWEKATPDHLIDKVRMMRERNKPVAAICGAVGALADAGLLDDIAHTGNSLEEVSGRAGYHGAAHYVARPSAMTADGMTTAPGTAPVSFMKAVCDAMGFGGPQLDYYVGLHAAQHAVSPH